MATTFPWQLSPSTPNRVIPHSNKSLPTLRTPSALVLLLFLRRKAQQPTRIRAPMSHSPSHLTRAKANPTSKAGVLGICNSTSPQSPTMAYTRILTTQFNVRSSTPASQPARSTTNHPTAVPANTTARTSANPANTVGSPKKCVRTPIALVCPSSFFSPLLSTSFLSPSPLLAEHIRSCSLQTAVSAFDDQTSTFIIPSGGGFEVIFCPVGRSSNILNTMQKQLVQLAQTGRVTPSLLADTQNITLMKTQGTTSQAKSSKMDKILIWVAILAVGLCWWA